MQHLIEYELPDGSTLLVETEQRETAGPRPAGAGKQVIERAAMTLEQAVAKVRPLAEVLLSQLKELPSKPEKVTIEFGVKLNLTTGIVVANTALEGNCKISLSWKDSD